MSIFSKKICLHFKTTTILFDFISQFWRSAILLSRTLHLFSKLASATNQQLFCVTEIDIGQRPLMNLWTMNYWLQYCDLHWDLVKCQRHAEECTKNLGDTFHCRLTIFTSDNFFFNLFSLRQLTIQITLKSIGWSG